MSVTVGYNAASEFVEEVGAAIFKNPSLAHVSVKTAKRNEGP